MVILSVSLPPLPLFVRISLWEPVTLVSVRGTLTSIGTPSRVPLEGAGPVPMLKSAVRVEPAVTVTVLVPEAVIQPVNLVCI